MKRNIFVSASLTLSILLMMVPAKAQLQPGESGTSLPPPPPGEGFGEPGGPGSGRPGGPEGPRAEEDNGGNPQREAFRQRMLEKFDTNHDGHLDDSERAQMHEFMQQRRMREQQNGGGPSGEFAGQNKQPGQGFGQQGAGPEGNAQWQEHRQKMLERFDTNHDGQLDGGEREKMHEFMQQRRMMREQQNGNAGGLPSAPVQQ